jgi:signal transduction histidine kinase
MHRQEHMNGFNVSDRSASPERQGDHHRTLCDLVPIAVYCCDGAGVIQEYNHRAAELWGRKPAPGDTDERFCGSFKLYRPDGSYLPHEECPMGDVLTGKMPGVHDAEVHIERPDGSRVIVVVSVAPLMDERGEIRGAINCFYDVTERKRMEEFLWQSKDALQAQVTERTEELTEVRRRLRALGAELTVMEQRERQRLAVDLHDELAQLLSLIGIKLSLAKQQPMQLSLAKMITEVEGLTDKAMTYTRTLMSQLSPPALSDSGLPMALQWLAEQMQQHNLFVSCQVKTEMPRIPENQALLLFQSSRELLLNCIKHAKTHEATMTLQQVDGSMCIQISDQGAGFDLAEARKKAHSPASGFGLLSIRDRMVSLGGRFELASSPGKGTTATLILPLSGHSVESFLATQDAAL